MCRLLLFASSFLVYLRVRWNCERLLDRFVIRSVGQTLNERFNASASVVISKWFVFVAAACLTLNLIVVFSTLAVRLIYHDLNTQMSIGVAALTTWLHSLDTVVFPLAMIRYI